MKRFLCFSNVFVLILLSLSSEAQIGDVQIARLVKKQSLAAWEQAVLGSNRPNSSSLLLSQSDLGDIRSSTPNHGSSSSVKILISIPLTVKEQRLMFGKVSQADLRSNTRLISSLLMFDYAEFELLKGASDLALALARTTDDNLIIIGHNEDGLLHFGDGSKFELKRLNNLSQKMECKIAVLSCHASDFVSSFPATNVRLSFKEAVSAAKKISEKTSAEKLVYSNIFTIPKRTFNPIQIQIRGNLASQDSRVTKVLPAGPWVGVGNFKSRKKEIYGNIFERNAKREIEDVALHAESKVKMKYISGAVIVGGAAGIYYKKPLMNFILYGNSGGDLRNRAIATKR